MCAAGAHTQPECKQQQMSAIYWFSKVQALIYSFIKAWKLHYSHPDQPTLTTKIWEINTHKVKHKPLFHNKTIEKNHPKKKQQHKNKIKVN